MTATPDERQRRWRAQIDLVAGRTQVRPIDLDPRLDPKSSQLLNALHRPARPQPEHHDEPEQVPEPEQQAAAMPLNPWEQGHEPGLAQPQDSDRRGNPDVRVPPAPSPTKVKPSPQTTEDAVQVAPPALQNDVGAICEQVTDGVMIRLRDMFGLPPEEPPIPELYGESAYTVLNPAGAFVTADPDPELEVAGSFVDHGMETAPPPAPVNPAGSFTAEPAA